VSQPLQSQAQHRQLPAMVVDPERGDHIPRAECAQEESDSDRDAFGEGACAR
jgi:hypothetical protein